MIDQIRKRMQAKDVTQAELARMTGLHRQAINRTLRGHRQPKPETLRRIVEALDGELEVAIKWK